MENNAVGKTFHATIYQAKTYTTIIFADNAEEALNYMKSEIQDLSKLVAEEIINNVQIKEIKQ